MIAAAWNGAEPCRPTPACHDQGHLVEVDPQGRPVCVTCGLARARAEVGR